MNSNPNIIWGIGTQAQTAVLTCVWLGVAKELIYSFEHPDH